MNLYSRKEALIGGGVTLVAIVVGLTLDALGWALFAAAAVGLGHQHRALRAFARWARKPKQPPQIPSQGMQRAAEALRRSLRQSRRRLREALDHVSRFRGVTKALPDAAVLVDAQGNIDTFNSASVDLLHLNRQDTGNNLGTLLRHPDAINLLKTQASGTVIEIGSPFAEGQRLELRRIKVADDQALILARDVTELNRLLSMRQDFIANVSHELRTPLTVIFGYLPEDHDAMDEDTMRHVLRKMRSPTLRMQALVDDLLMLTRLESSPSPEVDDLTAIDVEALISSVVDEVANLANNKQKINQHILSEVRVLGVEKELHSACTNLVTNAVKYSPQGGNIDITWSSNSEGAGLEVADQGVGIPPQHLSRLTERFYRVDLAGSRVRGGTGLGLAIVKHVLKRHNTRLEIESEVGEGSRFYCHFQPTQLRPQPES